LSLPNLSGGLLQLPNIDWVAFGKIKYDHDIYSHDVIISTRGGVFERETDDSHTITLQELESIIDNATKRVIIGMGFHGLAKVLPEAKKFARANKIKITALETPAAVAEYNKAKKKEKITLLLHLTC